VHYGPRVILPRRIKADLADGVISSALMIGPLLLGEALVGVLPELLLRVFVLSIPAAIGYALFRDALGQGTSLGKRFLGLRVITLADGRLATAGRVWSRNLLDVVPIVSLIDFIWMCVDRHGQKVLDRGLGTQVVEAAWLARRQPR
jgi:uncharacterized RDD family membrane protein YckC